MEPKIFWSATGGKGFQPGETIPGEKTLILMGDWCSKTDTSKPKETTAVV